jgi:hypothetical protein
VNEVDKDDDQLEFTVEEVRKYIRTNLFSVALNLRKLITEFDKKNKYRLFLISLMVTTCILIMTYINAVLQNVFHKKPAYDNFVKLLKIVSTIFGFKYFRDKDTCLANELMWFIFLFILLAYDVYVIGMIASLQKDIQSRIEELEDVDEEFRKETKKQEPKPEKQKVDSDEEDEEEEKKKLNRQGSDMSDLDSNQEEDFQDIFQLDLGADEKDAFIEGIDMSLINSTHEIFVNKEIELALLDDQDRQEIKIRALKRGNEASLKKYTNYSVLEELDLNRWNFFEFYIVSTFKEEDDFKMNLFEQKKFKRKVAQHSDDEGSANHEDDEGGKLGDDSKKSTLVSSSYAVSEHERKAQYSCVLLSKREEILDAEASEVHPRDSGEIHRRHLHPDLAEQEYSAGGCPLLTVHRLLLFLGA